MSDVAVVALRTASAAGECSTTSSSLKNNNNSGSATRAREILDSLKQQREELSQRALLAFSLSSATVSTVSSSTSSASSSPTTLATKKSLLLADSSTCATQSTALEPTTTSTSTTTPREIEVLMPAVRTRPATTTRGGAGQVSASTLSKSRTRTTTEDDTRQPANTTSSSSSSSSHSRRSDYLHEVVKERRENLLDLLKAASSARTISSHPDSLRSNTTGRTDDLSSVSPDHNNINNSTNSRGRNGGTASHVEIRRCGWVHVKDCPPAASASLTDDSCSSSSSSSSDDELLHPMVVISTTPELSPSTSPLPPTSADLMIPLPKRWSREEYCLPRELCWSMDNTSKDDAATRNGKDDGPRPKSQISLKGRYVSPSQIIAKRLGLGQHRLRKGSNKEQQHLQQQQEQQQSRQQQQQYSVVTTSSSHGNKLPPVVVIAHHDIVDDHQKRNMILRSMMLDVIFLRRQYTQVDAKRLAAAKSAAATASSSKSSPNRLGLWGPYAKCFLSADDVSLPFTSDSDTSGWFTDDDASTVITYGGSGESCSIVGVPKAWLTSTVGAARKKSNSTHSSSSTTSLNKTAGCQSTNQDSLDASSSVPQEAGASVGSRTIKSKLSASSSSTPSNPCSVVLEGDEERDDDEEWIMPEEMSDQICGAYGGMYSIYKKQRRVRLTTTVEV